MTPIDLTYLNNDADFSVLLGIAEKLYPGIYVVLAGKKLASILGWDSYFFLGDPASIELKFIELFQSF
jgi:hypothetical protein